MALQNFIKTVWIAGIMRALSKAHVFGSVANTAYQGELKNLGDRVQIMMISDPTITYDKKIISLTVMVKILIWMHQKTSRTLPQS